MDRGDRAWSLKESDNTKQLTHTRTHTHTQIIMGFPGGTVVKNLLANAGYASWIPGLGRSPWRRKWQPTPVFLLGKSHGQMSLAGCSPRGGKELDKTEDTHK